MTENLSHLHDVIDNAVIDDRGNGVIRAKREIFTDEEVFERGVRVVTTAPGGTLAPPRAVQRGPGPETEQEEAWYRTIVDQTVDSSYMKRYGTLEEQTAPIVFLASDEASYITCSVLPVGGDQG